MHGKTFQGHKRNCEVKHPGLNLISHFTFFCTVPFFFNFTKSIRIISLAITFTIKKKKRNMHVY